MLVRNENVYNYIIQIAEGAIIHSNWNMCDVSVGGSNMGGMPWKHENREKTFVK